MYCMCRMCLSIIMCCMCLCFYSGFVHNIITNVLQDKNYWTPSSTNQLAHFVWSDRQKCVTGCALCCREVQSRLATREGHTQPHRLLLAHGSKPKFHTASEWDHIIVFIHSIWNTRYRWTSFSTLTTQTVQIAPDGKLARRSRDPRWELVAFSSSCHHLAEIWLEETWLQEPTHHLSTLPPLPPSHSSSELHPPACEPDHLNTKQRNKDILKIEMLWFSKKHTAEPQRGNGERRKRQNKRQGKTVRWAGSWWESETLYWCGIGGWIHWFPVSSCPVTYGWFVIQSRFKHRLWTRSKPGFTSFSV